MPDYELRYKQPTILQDSHAKFNEELHGRVYQPKVVWVDRTEPFQASSDAEAWRRADRFLDENSVELNSQTYYRGLEKLWKVVPRE